MPKIIIERFAKFISNTNEIYYRLECLFGWEYDEIICTKNDIHSEKLFEFIRDTYDNENLTVHYPYNKGESICWTEISSPLEMDGKRYIITGIKSL